jgi:uncharacterized protein (DUF3820 family)
MKRHILMNAQDQEVSAVHPDPNALLKLAQATMPYGKYAGCRLVDLPESYVIWLSRKGFPKGELGEMLNTVYVIKANGLEYLFKTL